MLYQVKAAGIPEESRRCKSILERGITKAQKRHEIALAGKVKENPKRFY